MSRLTILRSGLSLVLLLVLGAIVTPSASAACRRVRNPTTEAQWNWNQGGVCETRGTGERTFANVKAGTGVTREGTYECVEVETGETGYWNNTECTAPGMGETRKYVWAFLYRKCSEEGKSASRRSTTERKDAVLTTLLSLQEVQVD